MEVSGTWLISCTGLKRWRLSLYLPAPQTAPQIIPPKNKLWKPVRRVQPRAFQTSPLALIDSTTLFQSERDYLILKRRVQPREYQTLPPALAQPATLFESIGQNQVTRKSHMTRWCRLSSTWVAFICQYSSLQSFRFLDLTKLECFKVVPIWVRL